VLDNPKLSRLLAMSGGVVVAGALALALASTAASAQEPPWPAIADVSPRSGPPGTQVTITGRNFFPNASVWVGDVEARVVGLAPTRVVAILGPHDPGRVSVLVRNQSGRSGARGWAFTYLPPVQPSTGPAASQ
jgi:hypothetical protein